MNGLDFERLFEASPVQLMVLAPDPPLFTVLAVTDAYSSAVHKRREELVGRPVFEALPVGPEDRSAETASRASFQRAIDLRVPDTMAVQRHDLERPASEGGGFETRYWSPVNTPVLDEDGRVVCIIHRVEDVTEFVQAKQKEAEQHALADELRTRTGAMEAEIYQRARQIQEANEKLRRANEELGELDRAKTVFFSNVSHELRTPLTLILGPLEELLRRNDLPAGTITELTVVRRNALRLTKLVNALLDFSRIEAGRARASYEPTDVGTLTSELASSFQSACERAGMHLVIDSPPCSTPVHVDRDMWEKIVLNLVSNAFKFTLEGEIEVKVRERDGRCELSVRDTGCGIPAEEQPRVFERFHRAPSTRGRSLEGTGIGLSLVHELVKLHGGEVTVQSTPGQGSTFTVRVPLGTAHLPADRLGAALTEPGTSVGAEAFAEEASRWLPARGGGPTSEQPAGDAPRAERPAGADGPARPRVLLAEDNADMRDYVVRLLEPTLEVLTAADGREALDLAGRMRPDLVLTDVMMPRLDGLGLVRELRADPRLRATPVILLSARAGEEPKGEGLEAGGDDYLVKPFSARELVARVTTNLRLARMRAEAAAADARADALRENDRRKDEFLAMLSHELRNPLAPIRNSLYVLERAAPGGERARRAQDVIERQVAHLTRMVEELLDVSRITQGKMQVQRERVELDDLVRGVVDDVRPLFDARGVTLRCELPREPFVVSGDPTRLAQVVGNLLGNAAKFTAPGGHCWLSLSTEDGETAELAVRDDGAGMEAEVLESLFRPFVQADRTLHRSPGGLGLGLAIVRGLVDAHGGAVEARSEGPGRGAELLVRLPLLEQPRPHLSVVPAADPPGQRLRVLVIEDNEDAAASLKEALELGGHEVEVATDGEAGLEKARTWRPDAIVSDIGLPRVDGYGVARAVRAEPALEGTCLVAITGYAALDDVRRSREAGFDHHLSKPPDLRELERILAACAPAAAIDLCRR